MTAIRIGETPALTARGRANRTVLDVGRAAKATVAGWWARRRAIRQLSAADDFMLRDMGLTRESIESAVRHGRR